MDDPVLRPPRTTLAVTSGHQPCGITVRLVEIEDERGEEVQVSGQGDSGDMEDVDGGRAALGG